MDVKISSKYVSLFATIFNTKLVSMQAIAH